MQRVLITGAAGTIGKVLRQGLQGRYPKLRLMDIAPLGAAAPGEELYSTDVRDMAAMEELMDGVDCVVHLAGIPEEDSWEKILPVNIVGCYNAYEAARRRKVRRFVFASSNHAVGFHRRERFIDNLVQPRPDSRYGVSKVFGEALGRLYADKHGMDVACLRIGSFRTPDRPTNVRMLNTWISHRDMVHLVERCIDAPSYHFVVAYGVSANLRNRWDNSNVRFLGYRPQDDSEKFAAGVVARNETEDPVSALFHGAFFCPMEFSGDTDKID